MKSLLSKAIVLSLCVLLTVTTFSLFAQAASEPTFSHKAGDINGDDRVNNKDLTRLFQFLSGWKVDVTPEALNTNGDQKINNKDITRLFKYLSGWNVDISIGINCEHGNTVLKRYKAQKCVTSGYSGDKYCKDCGIILEWGSEIPANGQHGDPVLRNIKAESCTEAGYTGDNYCSVCGDLLSVGYIVPATGHKGGVADCHNRAVCDICGKAYGELNPDNHAGGEKTINYLAAKCTEDGYSGDVYCAGCNELLNTGTVIPATGHSGTATYHSKAACNVCGKDYFADIRAYDQLNENQKRTYNKLNEKISELELNWFNIDFTAGTAVKNMETDIRVALHAVAYDHPEYFWMPKTYSYQYSTDKYTGLLREFEVSFVFDTGDNERGAFNVTKAEKEAMQVELDAKIEEILAVARTLETDFEKERYIHDYLCENITYDNYSAHLASHGYSPDFNTYTIYGALIKGTCVCEGYSRAMQLLMSKLGIPCGLVTGLGGSINYDTGELEYVPHMWNIINPGDGLYYLDVTFDDSLESSGLEITYLHNYFNLTTNQLEKNHMLDDMYSDGSDYSNPNADFNFFKIYEDKTEYYFYTKSGTHIYSNDASEAAKVAVKAWNSGKTMVEYEYDDGMTIEDVKTILSKHLQGNPFIGGTAALPFGNYVIIVFRK